MSPSAGMNGGAASGRARVPSGGAIRGTARPSYGAGAGQGPGGGAPGGHGPHGPGGGYGGTYGSPGGGIRPRWGRIFGVVVALTAVLATVAALGAWAYVSSLNDEMRRTDAFKGVGDDRPAKTVDDATNILLLGSDSRDPEAQHAGGKWRTDTIILLHVPANREKAYFISLPRDLWVQVPKSPDGRYGGVQAKLNAAYAWGGAPLMIKTVENFSGVRIDNLAIVDFWGFKQMVTAVNGVRMCPEMPPGQDSFRSIHKPHRVFKKGCQNMGGAVALDYIRQRKQFPQGDFARMRHQQEFVKALMNKATSNEVFTSPTAMNDFLHAVTKAMTVDQDFSLMGMALKFRNLRSKDLVFMTSPHLGTGMRAGQSVIVSDREKASSLFQAVTEDRMAEWLKDNPQKKKK